jgi:hypothetical protein
MRPTAITTGGVPQVRVHCEFPEWYPVVSAIESLARSVIAWIDCPELPATIHVYLEPVAWILYPASVHIAATTRGVRYGDPKTVLYCLLHELIHASRRASAKVLADPEDEETHVDQMTRDMMHRVPRDVAIRLYALKVAFVARYRLLEDRRDEYERRTWAADAIREYEPRAASRQALRSGGDACTTR